MYWTRLVLVRPVASLYSASPLKHHPTGKQWCLNRARWSLTLLCWALSRAAEPQILTSFVWRGRGSNHQPPACQANAQPLHYPAAVSEIWIEPGIHMMWWLNSCLLCLINNVVCFYSHDRAWNFLVPYPYTSSYYFYSQSSNDINMTFFCLLSVDKAAATQTLYDWVDQKEWG